VRPTAGVVAVAILFFGPGLDPAPAPAAPAADSQLSITVAPNPGYVGGTVSVNFVVHYDGSGGIVQFVVYPTLPSGMAASPMPPECTPDANGGCALPAVSAATTISVPFTLSPSAPGTYTITGQLLERTTAIATETSSQASGQTSSQTSSQASAVVRPQSATVQAAPQPPVSAVLTVLQPTIRVLPPVASPGQVVLVEGRDFPPGSVLTLGWKPGITAAAVPPVVDAAGTFTAQLLVMGGDRTGHRVAVASGEGFIAAEAPFLVTRDRLMPPLLGAGGPAGASR
jgi:hypothetical protein